MRVYLIKYFLLVIIISIISCNKDKKVKPVIEKTALTDCGCDSLWSKKVTKDFVSILETTTKSDYAIWEGYDIRDGVYILNAGKPNDSANCLGIWRQGKNVSYKCSKDVPNMLTPIYSYYLDYKEPYNDEEKLFKTSKNAPDFSNWMKNYGIEAAVYMPTDFPKFPFKIPTKSKAQLAIHETFHVQVMLRKWYTNKGFWPEWDKQPDRKSIQSCYARNDSITKLFEAEQKELVALIEFLLDNDKTKAIQSANKFIAIRENRYSILIDKNIKLNDSKFGDCRIGESFMEVEEGIADYASWVTMYNIGTASKEDLLRRYRAKQKDMFYLSGCMLLHASALMNNGNDKEIILKMVNASSVEEGNLYKLFKGQLELFRKNN